MQLLYLCISLTKHSFLFYCENNCYSRKFDFPFDIDLRIYFWKEALKFCATNHVRYKV